MVRTVAAIWPAATAVFSASTRTWSATTAKPRPWAPARAASMEALSANRLVWSAMSSISSTTVWISRDCWPRASTALAASFTPWAKRASSWLVASMAALPSSAVRRMARAASEAWAVLWATSLLVADIWTMAAADCSTPSPWRSAPCSSATEVAESSSALAARLSVAPRMRATTPRRFSTMAPMEASTRPTSSSAAGGRSLVRSPADTRSETVRSRPRGPEMDR